MSKGNPPRPDPDPEMLVRKETTMTKESIKWGATLLVIVVLALALIRFGIAGNAAAETRPNGGIVVATPTAATGGLRDAMLTETCDLLEQEGRLFAYCESVSGELVPFAPQESAE